MPTRRDLRFVIVNQKQIPPDEANGNSYATQLVAALAKSQGKEQALAVEIDGTKDASYVIQRLNAHLAKYGTPFDEGIKYKRSPDNKVLFLWLEQESVDTGTAAE